MLIFLNLCFDELKIINLIIVYCMKSINCIVFLDIIIKDNVMFNVVNFLVYINCRYNFKFSFIFLNY